MIFLTGLSVQFISEIATSFAVPFRLLIIPLEISALVVGTILLTYRLGLPYPAALLLGLALPIALGQLNDQRILPFALTTLAILLGTLYGLVWTRRSRLNKAKLFGLASAILVIAAALAVISNTDVKMVDVFSQTEVENRQVYFDTYFHSTWASMIKNYDTAALGFHGLIKPYSYHVLSHRFFASVSTITKMPIIETYGTIYVVLLIPLLYCNILVCAEYWFPSRDQREFIKRCVYCVICLMGYFSFKSDGIFWYSALHNAYAFSESYSTSLSLLLGMLCALRLESLWTRWGLAATYLLALLLCKVNVAFLATLILGVRLLYFENLPTRYKIAAILFATSAAGYKLFSQANEVASYGFPLLSDMIFSFARRDGNVRGTPHEFSFYVDLFRFFLVHYFYSWAFLCAAAAAGWCACKKSVESEAAAYTAVVLSAATAIMLVFDSWHGVVYYFSNATMFVSLPFLIVLVAPVVPLDIGEATASIACLARTTARLFGPNVRPSSFTMDETNPHPAQRTDYGLSQSNGFRPTWLWQSGRVLVTRFSSAMTLSTVAGILMWAGVTGAVAFGIPYGRTGFNRLATNAALEHPQTPFASYVRSLREIRDDPRTVKYLIYIAKDQDGFWRSKDSGHWPDIGCNELPVLATAVAERAAIYGFGPSWCKPSFFFTGFNHTLFESSGRIRIPQSELLTEAKRLGYAGYIDVVENGWTIIKAN